MSSERTTEETEFEKPTAYPEDKKNREDAEYPGNKENREDAEYPGNKENREDAKHPENTDCREDMESGHNADDVKNPETAESPDMKTIYIDEASGKAESQTKEGKDKKGEKSIGYVILDYAKIIGIVLLVGFLVQAFLLVNAEIPTGSMENTIMPGERIFGNRLAYSFSDPERYDIVIFKYPDDEKQLFIKRIIGMPGETVIISGGKVYIVGSETDTTEIPDDALIADPEMLPGTIVTDDSFIAEPMREGPGYDCVFRVPEDSYFMLGDNRNYSRDSRYWTNHFVSRDKLVGEAMLRYWPLTKIGLLGYDGNQEETNEQS